MRERVSSLGYRAWRGGGRSEEEWVGDSGRRGGQAEVGVGAVGQER